MKTIVRLLGITPEEIGAEVYQQLKIYPGETWRPSLLCELPEDDPRMQKMLQLLRQQGLTPWSRLKERRPGEFWMELQRIYDADDYEAASYFIPCPKVKFGAYHTRTAAGLIKVKRHSTSFPTQIGWLEVWFIVVADALKKEMEQAGLKHILFREIESPGRNRQRFRGHAWELTSDLLLPPLSPICRLFHDGGEPFSGDYDKGCHLIEGQYQEAELHYTAEALKEAGDFDLARTRERFGIKDHVAYPRLVASKRFYDFCASRKLKMDWIPVRIDGEG